MCGRYYVELGEMLVDRSLKRKLAMKGLNNYATKEVFPSSKIIALVKSGNQVDVDVLRWGIDLRGKLLINARSESLDEKPMYRHMKHQRCLVVASGFYEWKDKQKFYIQSKDEGLIYFAGIMNENKELLIVTGEAEQQMAQLHHRTPLIYHQDEVRAFLDGKLPYRVMNENLKIQSLNPVERLRLDV